MGILSRDQLLALGWTEDEIDDLEERGDDDPGETKEVSVSRTAEKLPADRACTRCGGGGVHYIRDGAYGTFECPCRTRRPDAAAPMPLRQDRRR